jgi:hypothetical protein
MDYVSIHSTCAVETVSLSDLRISQRFVVHLQQEEIGGWRLLRNEELRNLLGR